jgi:uncharacterized membrane protein SpoIIM required for sporulation/ABC-type transport system involved in multi-copper enzyme maturation permease subunit
MNARTEVSRGLKTFAGAWILARREIRDQFRDWRILTPIIALTLFFPLLMNFTAQQAVDFVERYGAPVIGDRLIPFLLMVVGFFPISISLVIALESFAGERERLSLEPLLATPLSDSQLYIGKLVASMAPPLSAAYLGIIVYLSGLYFRLGWTPEPQLLVQVIALTTVQALVMVSGAVVISSQTTSVRAANLLASFIIIPIAQLIIGESVIMFWGRYHILWWIILTQTLIAIVLMRIGLSLFNREELLGNELDVLDLRWAARTFWNAFRNNASSLGDWYRGVLGYSLRRIRIPILITLTMLVVGFIAGYRYAAIFTLPGELFNWQASSAEFTDALRRFGMFSTTGWIKIFGINLRAVAIAALLGIFTLGVLGEILLMAPIAIIGYFAGNVALAGQDPIALLGALVAPHGVLEVPAALIAGGAILQLGMAAISLPKGSSLGEGWIKALAEWFRIILGLVIPLLFAAAALEVFVTPRVAIWVLSGS